MNSILTSVKKVLGIAEENTQFDNDVILHINSVFMILNQIGVGPDAGFSIADATTLWTSYISDNLKLESVKTYVSLKVKLMFDPPASSVVTESMNKILSELEWRLQVSAESVTTE